MFRRVVPCVVVFVCKMGCFHPLKAYWTSARRDQITFDASRSLTKISFSLPCGRCIGCRLEKARQWGLRCLHEKKMWEHNLFVTLTYDDVHLPEGGSLCVRDIQLFMKKLRFLKKSTKDNPIRFFCGGEYGERNGRPHYHLLLFNCWFDDLRRVGIFNDPNSSPLYSSETLTNLWGMGHVSIGEVTFESAVYCAKYAMKKINGDRAKDHYEIIDEDGVVTDIRPEFALMSRRPGIGKMYYDKYGQELRCHDSLIVNAREVRPPRYYDNLSKEIDPEGHARIKRKRKRMSVLNRADNTPQRLAVKERLAEINSERKERKL